MDSVRLHHIVAGFSAQRVLVIGDLMLDEFVWGKVSRISPEAPVPVVKVTSQSYYPGGAANVARNVREFTSSTAVMGVIGADAPGTRLLELLEAAGIDTGAVERDANFPTTVKTRIIARNQQVVRVDRERQTHLTEEQTERAMRRLDCAMGEIDAIIVADYGKGYLSQPLADYICRAAREQGKILTVDPHPHTSLCWRNPTAVKPNRAEAFSAAGVTLSDSSEQPARDPTLLEAARRLQSLWNPESLLITLGEQGMLLFEGGAAPRHIPTRAKDVFDVSGAGDTALAVFTLGLASGARPAEAADLANRASGMAVGKLGTATVTIGELLAGFSEA
jgi:D-beta-D-heptose 7-phosphate kinase/D-beta-D-heptose 1-phosphate adenosyltransferase